MAERSPLAALSAFAHLAVPTAKGGSVGVTVAERRGLGIATVTLRKDAFDALVARSFEAMGITLVAAPKVSSAADVAFVGTGPRSWLAVKSSGGWRFAADLSESLAGAASVCDQSSGYAVLRLSGPQARAVLAKGVPVDLHPDAFRPGDAAVTLAGHIGIVLWQVDDAPSYDIAVFRSYAESFWHWLTESAAEFGLAVASPTT